MCWSGPGMRHRPVPYDVNASDPWSPSATNPLGYTTKTTNNADITAPALTTGGKAGRRNTSTTRGAC